MNSNNIHKESNPNITQLFKEFFQSESLSGLILLACTIISLFLTNSDYGLTYQNFWHTKLSLNIGPIDLYYSIEHWINDALMAIFFLLVGLEIERELYVGELKKIKNALLPIAAAVGGMLVPALFHFAFNSGTTTQAGFGIPMATDIAFALGMLALLGSKAPTALKIFLTALAIIDDLGAIIIIAVFYNSGLQTNFILLALITTVILFLLNKLKVNNLSIYLILGLALWFFILKSGVHATISGVILAFLIPFRDGGSNSPSYRLQHILHKPVAFFILPLFALANTVLVFNPGWINELTSNNSLGIILGLLLGKPIGIVLFSYLVLKLKVADLPQGIFLKHLLGVGFLAGIGFTMSIFISNLAFSDTALIQSAKLAVLTGSFFSCLAGLTILGGVCSKTTISSK